MQCLTAAVILGTWEIKSLLMTDDHRSRRGWAPVCNDTDMLWTFYSVLKAVSVQPCQVTGWISSSIMKHIIKVLVNKANVLSSSTHRIDLDIAKSLRWINGSFISSVAGHSRQPPDWDLRVFFRSCFMILQWLEQIMSSCGPRSLSFSGTSLAHWIIPLWHVKDATSATCEVGLLAPHITLLLTVCPRSGSSWGPLGCRPVERRGRQPSSNCELLLLLCSNYSASLLTFHSLRLFTK